MTDRIRLMERRDVDELIILDIAATPNNRGPRFDQIGELCSNLFCPVTVGGGINSLSSMDRLFRVGADKITLGTAALDRPEIITESSRRFGAQAIVIAIDVRHAEVYAQCGRRPTGKDPITWAEQVEDMGAGEILLTAIERDGMMDGYDIDLIREVADAVSIPVIAAGGCGSYGHIAEVMHNTGAHAVAVGAAFQFCDMTPKGASRYLHEKGFQVRL